MVDQNLARLPLSVKPTHYDVTIRTDIEKKTFEGFVSISLKVENETSDIVFNVADLTLSKISLRSAKVNVDNLDSTALTIDPKHERGTVRLPSTLPADSTATFGLAFQGNLAQNMNGYYLSGFEKDGQKSFYTLTQFEATAARRAFPCWDEPAFKAQFEITLISRADTVNLSNMSVESETAFEHGDFKYKQAISPDLTGEWKITHFNTTPPMSSYIVAFANGPFEYLEDSYTSPLSGTTRTLRMYATSDAINQCRYALDIKRKVLPIYEQIFDIEYPLPKLDTLVAHDFDAGAMENWGLITGRDSSLMADPLKDSLQQLQRVACTESHEVAHMWFGDITTMAWWDTLYLKEGFATLIGEYVVMDKIQPDWKVFTDFIVTNLDTALELDAKLSSHPVEVECPDADYVNQIFDDLSYCKAASVLRMLYEYVGEEQFVRGVSIYLKKRLYGNSESKDLWNGIAEATGLDIAKMMDGWITKMGFPVITVKETPEGIHIRQDRYLESGPALPEQNEYLWTVPLSLLLTPADGKATVDKRLVLDTREKSLPVDTGKAFKLNAGTTGFFRVLYTPERLKAIASEAAKSDSVFSLDDRLGLVFDSMSLAKSGHGHVSDALTVMNTFKNDSEYFVWRGISTNLTLLRRLWGGDEKIKPLLQSFARTLFVPLVKRLGWTYSETDSADTTSLRTLAIENAARAEDEATVTELRKRFAAYAETGDDSHIPGELERITFTTAMRHGGQPEYDALMKIVVNPRSPSSGVNAIFGITTATEPTLYEQTFAYTLKGAREQDLITFFRGFGSSGSAGTRLQTFFMENLDAYNALFEGGYSLRYLIESVVTRILSAEQLAEVEAFFAKQDTSKYNQALEQSLDTVKAHIAWLKRSTGDVQGWLEEWQKTGGRQ